MHRNMLTVRVSRTGGYATFVWQERPYTCDIRVARASYTCVTRAHMPSLNPILRGKQIKPSLRDGYVLCLLERKHIPPSWSLL